MVSGHTVKGVMTRGHPLEVPSRHNITAQTCLVGRQADKSECLVQPFLYR